MVRPVTHLRGVRGQATAVCVCVCVVCVCVSELTTSIAVDCGAHSQRQHYQE